MLYSSMDFNKNWAAYSAFTFMISVGRIDIFDSGRESVCMYVKELWRKSVKHFGCANATGTKRHDRQS